jgi:hypothetical protein
VNFDWYGASMDVDPGQTAQEALGAFEMASWYPSRGRHGFNRGMELRRGDTRIAELLWENLGAPKEGSCFLQATGRHAAPIAEWLREWQPVHRVARVDVAEDFTGPGTWDRLSTLALAVADDHDVKVEHAGDHHRAVEGRSLYLGGRASVVREIVYEKGKQVGGDPDWVRMELRVRPSSRVAKHQAAALAPAELYGCSTWSADMSARMGHPDVARLSLGTVYRDEDTLRSRNFLLRQYGPTLRQWKGELGSWSALASEFSRLLPDEE